MERKRKVLSINKHKQTPTRGQRFSRFDVLEVTPDQNRFQRKKIIALISTIGTTNEQWKAHIILGFYLWQLAAGAGKDNNSPGHITSWDLEVFSGPSGEAASHRTVTTHVGENYCFKLLFLFQFFSFSFLSKTF